jgi:tetratricopeptide (TPR) repeat protein
LSQTDEPKGIRKAILPVAIIGGLALILVLSNRPAVTIEGVPVITSNDQYNDLLAEVKELTKVPLEKSVRGEVLTPDELVQLRQAAQKVDALNAFQPTIFAPHLLAAKVYQMLGKTETAEQRVRQAIYNGDQEMADCIARKDTSRLAEVRLTMTEAHHVRSQLLVLMHEYKVALDEANAVLEAVPNSPEYLAGRASVLMQMGLYKKAALDLRKALTLDPNNRSSLNLARLFNQFDFSKAGGKAGSP